jgi:NAD(P)H-hydrate repair Nnr-like enzyme with NAD(P)H-hydrate dehydratase domain
MKPEAAPAQESALQAVAAACAIHARRSRARADNRENTARSLLRRLRG